jgi:hypothetical protein
LYNRCRSWLKERSRWRWRSNEGENLGRWMVWNCWCRCIYPLRCRFRGKDSMANASVILLRPKTEVYAQPISPFPSLQMNNTSH